MFLDDIFSRMDDLTNEFDMDRIRTIGDRFVPSSIPPSLSRVFVKLLPLQCSYFAVGGMKNTPIAHQHHTAQVLCFAYSVLKLLDEFNAEHINDNIQISFRMGINCGSCAGSVIGTKQITYDLWGDSVSKSSSTPLFCFVLFH